MFFFGHGADYVDVTTDPVLPQGTIEAAVASDRPIGNAAVSADGRLFYTVHSESNPHRPISTNGRTTARSTDPSPLMGKLFDGTGAPLTPSHAVKSGRRYRYYVSRRLIDNTVSGGESGWRLPAREIERIVAESVRGLLADSSALTHAARESGMAANRIAGLLDAVARWAGDHLDPVERVDVAPDIVEAILSGTQPVDLTAETLTKRAELPPIWSDQEALLGFE